jgi:3-methyladenine DNA glycosylase AlkD
VHERRTAVVELLAAYRGLLGPAHLDLVVRLVREARTWALVDGLAANVAGGIVERFPAAADTLDAWVVDPDFWVRRAALLALLIPLRRGAGDFDRFGRYADALLGEREFFVAKAIGWVLRDTARTRPELVAAWLVPRATRAAPVTVREAVKYLPPEDRARVLAARSGRGTSP